MPTDRYIYIETSGLSLIAGPFQGTTAATRVLDGIVARLDIAGFRGYEALVISDRLAEAATMSTRHIETFEKMEDAIEYLGLA